MPIALRKLFISNSVDKPVTFHIIKLYSVVIPVLVETISSMVVHAIYFSTGPV